jgi:hypothetical protein
MITWNITKERIITGIITGTDEGKYTMDDCYQCYWQYTAIDVVSNIDVVGSVVGRVVGNVNSR